MMASGSSGTGFGWGLLLKSCKSDFSLNSDVIVAYIHRTLLTYELRCVGIGDNFSLASTDESFEETLPDDWNAQNSDNYTLKYRNVKTVADKYILKVIVADDTIIVTFHRVSDEKTETVNLNVNQHSNEGKDIIDKEALEKELAVLLDPFFKEETKKTEEKVAVAPQSGRSRLLEEPSAGRGGPPGRIGDPYGTDPLGASDLDPLGRRGRGNIFVPGRNGNMGGIGGIPGSDYNTPFPLGGEPPEAGGLMGPGRGRGRRGLGDEFGPPGWNDDGGFGGGMGGGRFGPGGMGGGFGGGGMGGFM